MEAVVKLESKQMAEQVEKFLNDLLEDIVPDEEIVQRLPAPTLKPDDERSDDKVRRNQPRHHLHSSTEARVFLCQCCED